MRVQFLLKNTGMVERLGIMTLSSVLKKTKSPSRIIADRRTDGRKNSRTNKNF